MDVSRKLRAVRCPICLSPAEDPSLLDQCFHVYCFTCALMWSRIARACPTCKRPFRSIIHNVRSDTVFDVFACDGSAPPARALTDDEALRAQVYDRGLALLPPPPQRRATSSGADAERRLRPWVERELRALLRADDVADVAGLVMGAAGAAAAHEAGSGPARDVVAGLLGAATAETFARELEGFVGSALDMRAYDAAVRYDPPLELPAAAVAAEAAATPAATTAACDKPATSSYDDDDDEDDSSDYSDSSDEEHESFAEDDDRL
eukprot:m51a1_g253 hypothetical protein (264) ;mRNA; r:198743-199646